MTRPQFRSSLLSALAALLLAGCAHSPSYSPSDPLEKINRPIFDFNMKADRYVLRPVARGYVKVVPASARRGIGNFFSNLFYPTTIANDLLQAKFKQSGKDTLRFVMNSTIGLLGFMDVATSQGLDKNDEDLGQTLGYWGVGQGWYLMLPLLGPRTNRDLVGWLGDNAFFLVDDPTDPLEYTELSFIERGVVRSINVVNGRARLLDADKLLEQQLDRYVFVRTIYLDRRQNLVYDGNPPEEEFEIEEEEPDAAAAVP